MPVLVYSERTPPARLEAFIECTWIVRGTRGQTRPEPNRILPDGCPEWIVHAGDRFQRWVGQRWVTQPRSFLAGTLTRPWLVRNGSVVRTLGIRFKPGAAATLLGISLADVANRELDLLKALGAPAERLTSAVCRAKTTAQMFDAAEAQLLSLGATRLDRGPRTARAVRRVIASRGRLRIDGLAASLSTSRRTLERHFDAELGITPKQYARIVRFNTVLASAAAKERAQLVELALEAGYFDEAHLLRDVRSLAERKLRRESSDGELGRHFTRPDRLHRMLEQILTDPR